MKQTFGFDSYEQAPALERAPVGGGFRHWLMLYADVEGFVCSAGDFLREGVARGEDALVVVPRRKIDALRGELGPDADRIRFEDMESIGRNPARIIPVWRDFVERNGSAGRGSRGIGEPVYPERSAAELVECQLHEALLNVAFADADDFTLLCPYNSAALPAPVIEEAFRTHPAVHTHGSESPSRTYLGSDARSRLATSDLPVRPISVSSIPFERTGDLLQIRSLVTSAATEFGLDDTRTQALVLVVHEAAANSIVHGGGGGTVSFWRERDSLVVEIEDTGYFALGEQPLVGRVRPGSEHERGRGLWLANQLADLVQVRATGAGTTVRIAMQRVAAPSARA